MATTLLKMEPEWFPTLIAKTALRQVTRSRSQALNTKEVAL